MFFISSKILKLIQLIKLALSSSPKVLARKLSRLICNYLINMVKRKVDARTETYIRNASNDEMNSYFHHIDISTFMNYSETFIGIANNYFEHKFDLLGSGWVEVKYGMKCNGVEGYLYSYDTKIVIDSDGLWLKDVINKSNCNEAQRIWKLLDKNYCAIDWQLDFKSGFRWSEKTWYKDIQYGNLLGVDIKVPWELARMYHMPQMAITYSITKFQKEKYEYHSEKYVREFRNQILDFIATNPPRYGVNWVFSMDVAIRVSNWLVAFDIFASNGVTFDDEFLSVFKRSIYEHGKHIIENLEWLPELHGNHYLANITGLLFVGAYLPSTSETNAWLSFSVQELIKEVETQFHSDGSNFEASTNYHHLSAEMVMYATAITIGVNQKNNTSLINIDYLQHHAWPKLDKLPLPFYKVNRGHETPFPQWYLIKLLKIAEFSQSINRPDGHILQIGDNDSGSFLKLFPAYLQIETKEVTKRFLNLSYIDESSNYWLEDTLDKGYLVSGIQSLFEFDDLLGVNNANSAVTSVINGITGGGKFDCLPITKEVCFKQDDFKFRSYADFGLYIYKSCQLYLAVRCGSVGQNGLGGHAHNDQLSFELSVNGCAYIVDPGTYLYTALPDRRNAFRSTSMHNTLVINAHEQNGAFDDRLFLLKDQARAKVDFINAEKIDMVHYGYDKMHIRKMEISNNCIYTSDEYTGVNASAIHFMLAPSIQYEILGDKVYLFNGKSCLSIQSNNGIFEARPSFYSAGYGMCELSNLLILNTNGGHAKWKIIVENQ